MKYIDHSGKIDLSGWNLFDGPYATALKAEFIGTVECALKEIADGGRISFPIEYAFGEEGGEEGGEDGLGGKRVEDPTTIYLHLPFDSHSGDFAPVWGFSLKKIVEDAVEYVESGEGGPIKGNSRKNIKALRDGLRDLVVTLDSALQRQPSG